MSQSHFIAGIHCTEEWTKERPNLMNGNIIDNSYECTGFDSVPSVAMID
jgi:hypothetical protein